ncbi:MULTISPECIES: hypothetical protein [Butyricimonas]|uniref:hypothetical protein n=1 Tax=Butyricimonas TaxID=574697 RepID=UPI0007FB377F|nr:MULTISPECIES: hypothetical protein [Butyricimonas]
MLKKYLLYGMGCLLAFSACNKDDEEITTPSHVDRDWFVIQDKPGELNQLIYKVYTDTRVPIFVNDTLGEECYATDAQGNPIMRVETFNIRYSIFGDTLSSKDLQTRYAVNSADTTAMMYAVQTIRDKVIPYLAKAGEGRPKSFYLVDSINDLKPLSRYSSETGGYVQYYYPYSLAIHSAQKGVVVGKLGELKRMIEENDDEGVAMWAGRVLAAKVVEWILGGGVNKDLLKAEWYNITTTGLKRETYEDWWPSGTAGYTRDLRPTGGLFGYKVDLEEIRVFPSQEQDLLEYVALVYVYRNRDTEFYANPYYDFDKVHRKYEGMKKYVEAFEALYSVE